MAQLNKSVWARRALALVAGLALVALVVWMRVSARSSKKAGANQAPSITAANNPAVPQMAKARSRVEEKGASVDRPVAAELSTRNRQEVRAGNDSGLPNRSSPESKDPSWKDKDPKDLTPEDIMAFMRDRYAALTSYTDRGRMIRRAHELRTVYQDVGFRSFFKRPMYYRFEWLGNTPPHDQSYWSNDHGVFERLAPSGALRRFRDLSSLFRPAMVEPAYDVLQFLVPEAVPIRADFFLPTGRLPDEVVDGISCYHLQGMTPVYRHDRELWIGVSDGLLRRVRTVGNYSYSVSRTPVYRSGWETVTCEYLDVCADIELANELFFPTSR